jgi:serine/threonine-protein kinase
MKAGERLGAYEVIAKIGEGGMGEVYRARDTKLDRAVAIKILPDAFATDSERIARFQREAKTLASLNHSNIAHIHGLEESGGIHAIVMELVEGEDLAQRIAHGAIPVAEALHIAKQIADALEAAHAPGIVHRDLKPANIKLRPNGTVKVLDFGLAKAMLPADVAATGVSQSPTITTPALTEAGVILGTAAYMSPEQARGKTADTRADIWAFGCVLFEMLTGQRAFDGQGVSETLARVIEREPDWSRLPATLSPALRTYIRRCLEKDPGQRVQSIGDVRLALEGAFDADLPHTAPPAVAIGWRRLAFVGVAAIIAGAAITGSLTYVAMRQPPSRVSRLQVVSTGSSEVSVGYNDLWLAITPDGSRLAYTGNVGTQIFVRALDSLSPVAVYTGRPLALFTSPDGQWIGFREGTGIVKRVPISGGPAVTLATVDAGSPAGATWAPDGSIILAGENVAIGLQRVSVPGGQVETLTRPDSANGEADHLWPEMLPDGRSVLFTITALTGDLAAAQVAILDLQTGKRQVLLRGGSHAHYVAGGPGSSKSFGRDGGVLVYGQAGTLQAVAFDPVRREVRGTPVTVAADVVTSSRGGIHFVAARDDTVAYLSGSAAGTPRTLVWVDRLGRETPVGTTPRPYFLPALSPDGTRISVFANDQDADLWLWDLRRSTFTRFTSAPGRDVLQVWTPDSRRVIFSSEQAGGRNLYWQAADGTSAAERLLESVTTKYPMAVTPNGRQLIFTEETAETDTDLMAIELDETHRVTPVLKSRFAERNGAISPDGKWLAYEADDSSRFEIYVRPYPDVNAGLWKVSTDGGTKPLWTKDTQELIYVSLSGALMRVGWLRGASWSATNPSIVVKEGYSTNPTWWGRSYDVSADGKQFLMIKEGASGATPPANLIVVQHWGEELKRLVPTR